MSAPIRSGAVVCFGEMLLRLSSQGGIPLAQTSTLALDVGGAEANVAAALASLGCPTRMVTALPDNPLGQQAIRTLGAAGVDTRFVCRGDGRIGLYFFEPPTGPIGGRVTYDRSHSLFAGTQAAAFDFTAALKGATLLHMSGITPALGPTGVALAEAITAAATEAGVPICFDGNYRANLWDAWECDPRAILTRLVSSATILIGNHRDISLLLGKRFSGDGPDRRREAAEAAFAEFPNLQIIASTARHVESATVHRLSARVDRRRDFFQTKELRIAPIIDRIGTGDAFAAGLLYRWSKEASAQEMAETGLKLAIMKHGLPGDMILASRDELDAFDPVGADVRR